MHSITWQAVGRRVARHLFITVFSVAILAHSIPSPAFAFFIIFPIPVFKTNPDKIDATRAQRKLAMCAAYHRSVVDSELDGTREDSWHGEVINAALERLSDLPDAKKLIGGYRWQWSQQQKQNFESGQAYGFDMIEGCNESALPVHPIQYDYWARLREGGSAESVSLRNLPATPVKLKNLISNSDLPHSLARTGPQHATEVTLQIDREGAVADCFVEETSGSDELDDVVCNVLKSRAEFRPAIEDGFAVVSEFAYKHTWSAP